MAEISDEKREQMNRLYFAAINLREAQLEFCDGANVRTMEELMDSGDRLGMILTEINGGKSFIVGVRSAGPDRKWETEDDISTWPDEVN